MKGIFKGFILSSCFVLCMFSVTSYAQFQPFATFEIGEALLPAQSPAAADPTPFTFIPFNGANVVPPVDVFQNPPNVFVMTPQFAGDPCIVRIRNVTTTGFEATCLEPINEDRNTPAVTFEYIAVADGGVTVPLADGSGDVIFESSCVDVIEQQWGGNCDACAGAETFQGITFNNSFNDMPALLAQIQTAANENQTTGAPSGEPEFISTFVGDQVTTSLTATGFNLAIDRMEAGSAALLTEAERICYLAAETSSTCQSLDFSSLGGPSTPVMFQALNTLQNINGQGDAGGGPGGVGQTTNFAASCFTNTPLALASLIVRNGGDGAFLRRIDVTTTGTSLIVDEDTVEDGRGHGADEQASIFAFGEAFTTPVTLTGARVSRVGPNATFDWEI